MPEEITTESVVSNIMETISDSVSKHKEEFFPGEKTRPRKLFGREKPVHHCLGGGKSADVLLWRNKKISAGLLGGAAITWILFEWLNYHFLTLLSFGIVMGMLVQFAWRNVSSSVPRLVIPDEVFVNAGEVVGAEVNHVLGYLQDVACEGTMKQFLVVAGCLFAAAIVGGWCDFLTLIFIGFVAAHTLPVLYEKYEDQIDDFAYSVLEQLQHNYRKLDAGVLSKLPKTKFTGKKID
ncbi:reticulon-like protein B8 [Andrographis paniculata]|uniref:reticulon-like protein B8 n=1 Tax=Andrographis paniculata TaxID=175694 RepID=UPI0021E75BC9|nr:reticulon-like protein B8 [Andrographis paniculata]